MINKNLKTINKSTGKRFELTLNSYLELLGDRYAIEARQTPDGSFMARLTHDDEDGRETYARVEDCACIGDALSKLDEALNAEPEPFYKNWHSPQTPFC